MTRATLIPRFIYVRLDCLSEFGRHEHDLLPYDSIQLIRCCLVTMAQKRISHGKTSPCPVI